MLVQVPAAERRLCTMPIQPFLKSIVKADTTS